MKLIYSLILFLSLIAVGLSSLALFKPKDEYRGYASREELVRAMTLKDSSNYGSAYDVALKRMNHDEVRRSFYISEIVEHNGMAVGFSGFKILGKDVKYAIWMRSFQGKWYEAYIAEYKKGSYAPEDEPWVKEMSAKASQWMGQSTVQM